MTKKIILSTIAICIAVLGTYFIVFHNTQPAPTTSSPKIQEQPEKPATETFNKEQYSTTDPASIWVIVNKRSPLLPVTYTPTDLRMPDVPQRVPGNESMRLRDEAATAVETMFAAAQQDGFELQVSSAHRSYGFQVSLYGGYVQSQGQAVADTQSARPGYSEHQTGLAVDIRPVDGRCHLQACFGELAEGKWVKEHAHKYGFIMRYTPTKQSVTGYMYEPWHFRYVGKELAAEMHQQNIETLEEFFNLGAAPDYI